MQQCTVLKGEFHSTAFRKNASTLPFFISKIEFPLLNLKFNARLIIRSVLIKQSENKQKLHMIMGAV